MRDIGHPILGDKKYGDKKYGDKKDRAKRLMLHAESLVIINPKTKQKMEFNSKVPTEFETLFKEVK